MIHDLKILPEYFRNVRDGKKNFELRKNDRDFNVNDILHLKEWNGSKYTGRSLMRKIKYILKDCPEYGLNKDFLIIGL